MQTFCCTKGACVEGQLTSALHRLASEDLRSNSQGDTHTHTHTNTHTMKVTNKNYSMELGLATTPVKT